MGRSSRAFIAPRKKPGGHFEYSVDSTLELENKPSRLSEAERRRLQAEEGHQMIPAIDCTAGGYFEIDAQGNLLYVDHGFAVLLRASARRLVGKSFLGWLAPTDRDEYKRRLGNSTSSGQVQEWKSSLLLTNNDLLPVMLTLSTVLLQNGDHAYRGFARALPNLPPEAKTPFEVQQEFDRRVRENSQEMMITNQKLAREIENRQNAEFALRKHQEELERRVSERTAELDLVNKMLQGELAERRRAEHSLEQRARELSALHAATAALLGTLDLDTLIGRILDAANIAIPAGEKGMLYLMAETGQLEMRAAIGYTDSRIQKLTFSGGRNYISQAVLEQRPMLVSDLLNEPSLKYEGVIPEVKSIQSAIVAPLVFNDTVLGVLSLESSRPNAFTEEDKSLLVTFAATATAAYRNAVLHSQVQKLALTDGLTSIYNRRGFFEVGKREIERSKRFNRPVSAIMFDLDLFKDINDNYGHENGDEVLRLVAGRITANIREIDIFGRYGGDEFVVLLPECDLQVASNVAERLRACIETAPMEIGDQQISITISLGVATATNQTSSLAELIDQADAAMYGAKQSGRNRIATGL